MKSIHKVGTEQSNTSPGYPGLDRNIVATIFVVNQALSMLLTSLKPSQMMRLMAGILLFVFVYANVNADNDKPNGNVIFKGKVFIKGEDPHDLIYATEVSLFIVQISRGVDRTSCEFKVKRGIFKEKLELNESYVIAISKQGYEAKYFQFSTVGADPHSKYEFHTDIILKKEGEARDYSEEYPFARIAYDNLDNAFVLVDN